MKVPKIITIACNKGGVGKSTIALCLAVEMAKSHNVTLLDLDVQKSTVIFNRIRENAGYQPLDVKSFTDIASFKKLLKNNQGITIIDLGAFDSDVNRIALLAADLIITPVSDSEVEIFGLLIFNKTLEALREIKPKLKAHVLPNRLSIRSSNIKELENQVKRHSGCLSLMTSRIGDRTNFKKMFISGKTVTEMKSGPAYKEIIALIKEIEKCLKNK